MREKLHPTFTINNNFWVKGEGKVDFENVRIINHTGLELEVDYWNFRKDLEIRIYDVSNQTVTGDE